MKKPNYTTCIFLLAAVINMNSSISLASVSAFASDEVKIAQCKALASVDFSEIPDAPTQLTSVNFVSGDADLPPYCQVNGYVAPSIGFEIRMPGEWNGKFLHTGCGGHCGTIYAFRCSTALRKGYACLASDMGHKGAGGLWGYKNLQAKWDWGVRATHVATLAGKEIAGRYYKQPPHKSYFMGCSTGGRQALQAAQRFPWDFDGIIAGAPPVDLSTIYMTFAWGIRAMNDNNGNALLDDEDLKLLTASAKAQCDLDDGVKDGIIGDPARCAFDPSVLLCKAGQSARKCLTRDQVDAVKKVYAGPMTSEGVQLSHGGPMPGSEYGVWMGHRYDWSTAYFYNNKSPFSHIKIAIEGLRYLFFFPEFGPKWNLRDFDFDHDYKRLSLMQAMYDSSNPDLRKFKQAGGKLMIYQGMNDFSVLPRSTIDYYETVQRTMGGEAETQDFARLFLLPGVGHCSGGDGAFAVDYLSYLEAWVEKGQVPDKMISARPPVNDPALAGALEFPVDPATVEFTRPVYPYPLQANYMGDGDPNDAKNWGPIRSHKRNSN